LGNFVKFCKEKEMWERSASNCECLGQRKSHTEKVLAFSGGDVIIMTFSPKNLFLLTVLWDE